MVLFSGSVIEVGPKYSDEEMRPQQGIILRKLALNCKGNCQIRKADIECIWNIYIRFFNSSICGLALGDF